MRYCRRFRPPLVLLTAFYAGLTAPLAQADEKVAALPTESAQSAHHLLFEANFGGLNAADFLLSYSLDSQEGPLNERINRFHLETKGVARWVFKLWIKAEGRGLTKDGGTYIAQQYRVDYTNRFRTRSIDVTFDPQTGKATPHIKTVGATEENDKANEDKVPPEKRFNVIDPIAAVAEAIRHTRDHLENGGPQKFRLPVYDGRRRYDIIGEVRDRFERTILDKVHKVRLLVLAPETVAGFKKSHQELWKESAFHIYLSDDGRYVPLQIDAIGPGPMINLVRECETAEACRPEGKS
jgi:hypothetical protein